MKHSEYRENLSALLDGELSSAERGVVLAHLNICAECRAYWTELAAMRDALSSLGDVDVPDGFTDSVLARLRAAADTPPSRRLAELAVTRGKPIGFADSLRLRRRWAGLAACAVVALAVATLPRMGMMGRAAPEAPAMGVLYESSTVICDTMEDAAPEEAAEDPSAREAGVWESSALMADAGAGTRTYGAAEAKSASEPPVLTLMGEDAAVWLDEHAEPLGDGRWLVTVEAANALPDTLALVGLQEPIDGTLVITLGTTENS